MPDRHSSQDPTGGSPLPDNAYAVLLIPQSGFELRLPKSMAEMDSELPDAATALLACATRLANDPSFVEEQVRWMESQRDSSK